MTPLKTTKLFLTLVTVSRLLQNQNAFAFSTNSVKSRMSQPQNSAAAKPALSLPTSHTRLFGFLKRKTVAVDSYSLEQVNRKIPSRLYETSLESSTSSEDTEVSSKAEEVLEDIHSNGFKFRIVVIGNGAILETTSILGPNYASNISPKTGDRIITLSSEDKSFEFHVKVEQVSKITFSEVVKPIPENDKGENTKIMRLIRLVNLEGGPMCSLILVDSDEKAVEWFSSMIDKFGSVVEMES